MKNYLILSSGSYSDYEPTYFVGEKVITQEELTAKAEEIGTKMWNEWVQYPTRTQRENWSNRIIEQKYDPLEPEKYISNSGPDDDEFIKKLTEWLATQGYEQVPDNLPEINVYYDVPGSPTT